MVHEFASDVARRISPFALFPVADGLVGHVDASRELDLGQPKTPAHTAGKASHVAHRLGVVVARLAGDVLLAGGIQHLMVDPPARNALRVVRINVGQPAGARGEPARVRSRIRISDICERTERGELNYAVANSELDDATFRIGRIAQSRGALTRCQYPSRSRLTRGASR